MTGSAVKGKWSKTVVWSETRVNYFTITEYPKELYYSQPLQHIALYYMFIIELNVVECWWTKSIPVTIML